LTRETLPWAGRKTILRPGTKNRAEQRPILVVPERFLLPESCCWSDNTANLHKQRRIREQWGVAVPLRLRPDMNLPPPFKPGPVAVCPQGQRVQWLGYEMADDRHWFGVSGVESLCPWCWRQVSCPRQFAYEPAAHEIWTDPLASRVSRQLLQQARSWIQRG